MHEEPDDRIYFNPCTSCGMSNVLKPGDYCRACATTWRLPSAENEYIIVSPATLEAATLQSGIAKSYLKAKQEEAFERDQKYVIYFARGQWDDLIVSNRFYLPVVMKFLFEQLEEN
jgi:hypothetical protein